MVSSKTANRRRKVALLREVLDGTLALLLLEHKDRDRVHMPAFKKLTSEVKGLVETAKTGKLPQKPLLHTK